MAQQCCNKKIHGSSHNSIEVLTQYINLLLDKQNFMISRFEHMDTIMGKTIKENISLKKHVDMLENKTKVLTDRIDNLCEYLTDDNEHHHYHSNEEYDVDDDKSSTKSNSPKAKQPKIVIMPAKGKPGKQGNQQINPFEMLLNHINGETTAKKEKQDESNSDDEYDVDEPIYEEHTREDDKDFIEINKEIKNINDLIDLADQYEEKVRLYNKKKTKNAKHDKHKKSSKIDDDVSPKAISPTEIPPPSYELYELDGKKYGINLETVVRLAAPLKRLNKMIGMKKVKDDIFEMIIYYLQGFEKNNKNMLHSVIEGPPGVGKTKLGKILAQIYCALGIISTSKFKYVKATDLIGDHVGATKHMTQGAIDEADGGVLFIDEAYALSSNDKKDPYGKECLDTLNFNLSENKKKLIVIIAGYSDHLDKYFFSFNPGLSRRFPFKFKIDGYSGEELRDIFIDKLKKFKWKLDKSVTLDHLTTFFKSNKDDFPNFGGDIENFFKSCQFSHSKRLIGKHPNLRSKITRDDITLGFEKFKKNKRENTSDPKYPHMYI